MSSAISKMTKEMFGENVMEDFAKDYQLLIKLLLVTSLGCILLATRW